MKREEWDRLLLELLPYMAIDPDVQVSIRNIPQLSANQRAELIRMSRIPYAPIKGTTLYQLVSRYLSEDQISLYSQCCYSHLNRSILLWLARNGPVSEEESQQMLLDSFKKEFDLTQVTRPKQKLNFSCIFSDSTEPLHEDIPYNREACTLIRSSIDDWISNCKQVIHYPHMSRKSISVDSRDRYRQLYPDNAGEVTQVSLESDLLHRGEAIGGVCEIRQRYYQSQFTPRTYYAMGGLAFQKTKYMKRMFADLCDQIDSSHRYSRTVPNRLVANVDQYLLAYDLTSFTSNLVDHYNFLYELSRYCEGQQVRIHDGIQGTTMIDFGELIRDLATMHFKPEFVCHRIGPRGYKGSLDLGGFLGVNANITSAMFLHVIVMLQFVSSTNKLNVAGDDGLVVVERLEEEYIRGLECIGTIHPEKIFRSNQPGCISLKRGIYQTGLSIAYYPNVVPPSLEYQREDSRIDPRYLDILNMSDLQRRSATASSVKTFLSSLIPYKLDQWEEELVIRICRFLYTSAGLPLNGFVPQVNPAVKLPFTVMINPLKFNYDPVLYTLEQHYTTTATVQLRYECLYDAKVFEESNEIVCNSNPWLNYYEALSLIEKESIPLQVYGVEGLQKLKDEYLNADRVVYKYKVINKAIFRFG